MILMISSKFKYAIKYPDKISNRAKILSKRYFTLLCNTIWR